MVYRDGKVLYSAGFLFCIIDYHKVWIMHIPFVRIVKLLFYSFDSFSLESSSLQNFLSILADPNNAVVSLVLTCSLIFKSSSSLTNRLRIVPSETTVIGITVTFMFHSFFSSLARFRYLSLLLSSFNFTIWSTGTAKSAIQQVLFFCWLSLGLVFWPRLGNPFVFQNPWEVCAFLGRSLGCA